MAPRGTRFFFWVKFVVIMVNAEKLFNPKIHQRPPVIGNKSGRYRFSNDFRLNKAIRTAFRFPLNVPRSELILIWGNHSHVKYYKIEDSVEILSNRFR